MIHDVDHRALVAHIAQIVGKQDAEDVVQDAYVKILSTVSDFKGLSSAKTWVYTVARRCAFDFLAARNRQPSLPVHPLKHTFKDTLAAQQLERVEIHVDLERAIGLLSPKYQAVVLARMCVDTPPEAAALLGMTPAAFKACHFRAVKKLREEMTKHD